MKVFTSIPQFIQRFIPKWSTLLFIFVSNSSITDKLLENPTVFFPASCRVPGCCKQTVAVIRSNLDIDKTWHQNLRAMETVRLKSLTFSLGQHCRTIQRNMSSLNNISRKMIWVRFFFFFKLSEWKSKDILKCKIPSNNKEDDLRFLYDTTDFSSACPRTLTAVVRCIFYKFL